MLTSFARGAKSKLARLCLGGSMLFGLSGCLTPRGEQMMRGLGYGALQTYINESVAKEVYGSPQNKDETTYAPREERNVSAKRRSNGYPVLFTGSENFKDVGKQIFYSGEKIYIRGNLVGLLPNGTTIANKNTHLSSGQRDFVTKHIKVGEGGDIIYGRFDAKPLAENIGTGEYENVWYFLKDGEWKEIGRVRYAVFKNNYSLSQ